MSTQRFPLDWPAGWKRTAASSRQRSRFKHYGGELSVQVATRRLVYELERLGASAEILSTNVALRIDGLPRGDAPAPSDPGAAVYFQLLGKPQVLACDLWATVAGNIGAIAAHIDALRAIARHGVGSLEQAFRGYTALAASTTDWWTVLGVEPTATLDQVETAFRARARTAHPDAGGTHDAMARLTLAREQAKAALK